MKKLTTWLATLVALVVGVCCLSACDLGKKVKGGNTVTGTYKFYSMTMDGTTYLAGQEINIGAGSMQLTEDLMTLELKADGTCSMKSSMASAITGEDALAEVGIWKKDEEDENKIIITIDGSDQVFTKDGNKLISESEGGMQVVLKK